MVATTSSWRPAMVLWPPAHRRGYGKTRSVIDQFIARCLEAAAIHASWRPGNTCSGNCTRRSERRRFPKTSINPDTSGACTDSRAFAATFVRSGRFEFGTVGSAWARGGQDVRARLRAVGSDGWRLVAPWAIWDPRITTEVYGHLVPDYLRSEIDRLRFGTAPANDLSSDSQPLAARGHQLLTTDSQGPRSASSAPSDRGDFREENPELTVAGWTGLEPAASGVTGRL
jgi:hypothetical protein